MSKKSTPSRKRPQEIQLSPAKKRLFTIVALFVPVLFFLLIELVLRLGNYGGTTRLFVPTPDKNSPWFGLNQNAGKRFFYRGNFLPSPRKDLFLRVKPENGYRIFVLGESSTAGFPYGNNLTFPRILQRRLLDAFPEKRVEVVNCAFTAINTYTMLDYLDEVLEQQPDLILIYTGHNEFYGALGVASMESLGQSRWFVKGYLRLQRLKTFIWVRDVVAKIRQGFAGGKGGDYVDPTETFMSRIVRDKNIPLGSKIYGRGVRQFRDNMEDIIAKAQKAGVPVILSELVSNIRDLPPFVSQPTVNYPSASSEYQSAQELEKRGDFVQAKEHYYFAKDLDALRFRAPEEFNTIVHDLAKKYSLPVVPMKKIFEDNSPNGLVGDNLMWEHLHPKSQGYFLMAEGFFQTMFAQEMIAPDWRSRKFPPAQAYELNWGLTKLDSVYAEMSIRQLKGSWPFVQDGRPNLFMSNFKPKTRQEQIAAEILIKGEGTLETGHLTLAAEYEKAQDYISAFREYKALIYTVPTLDVFYEPMVQLLMHRQEYGLALRILFEALRFQDSAFVYKWIGQVYLVLEETERGIAFMEEALKRDPGDDQTLYNITRAYYRMGRFAEGDRYLQTLRVDIANTRQLQELEDFRRECQAAQETTN